MNNKKIEINIGLANQFVIDIENIPMSIGPGVGRWLEEQWSRNESIVIRGVLRSDSNCLRLVLMRKKDAR